MNNSNKRKINFLDIDRKQLQKFFLSIGEKIFRADQIMKWIYHFNIDNFDYMTNITKNLRIKLKKIAEIKAPIIYKKFFSKDGVIKWAFKINNKYIETVYIPEKKRSTICISSQIGCALKCDFCATTKNGFKGNLKVSEIIGQIWLFNKFIKKKKLPKLTNIVFMGMGEPLLNIKNVVSSIKIILDDFGFGISKHHLTLSTSGISPAIKKLGNIVDISLAISLHAPNNNLRNKIMPINRKYNINSVLHAAKNYLKNKKANKGKITIEYIMIDHFNDSIKFAHQLTLCLKNIPCKINLIPFNYFSESLYHCSSKERIFNFFKFLVKNKFNVTIRKSRGSDINAACGQLYIK